MKICLAAYGHRLASLFDNSPELKMYMFQDGQLYEAGQVLIPQEGVNSRLSTLTACGVDVLICGAVSGCTKQMLHQSGIHVWDWIRGDLDKVIQAWMEGTLSECAMPGCRKKGCCQKHESSDQAPSTRNSASNKSRRRHE